MTSFFYLLFKLYPWPIPQSKGMHEIFQKKGQKMLKKGNVFENLGNRVQNLKIF